MKKIMERINWSQSPDGYVSDFEVHPQEDYVLTRVTIPFAFGERFEHFERLIHEGNACFDLRSRIAQFGLNFGSPYSVSIDQTNAKVSLEGRLYPWTEDYKPHDGKWWDLIDPEIFKVGKLVNISPNLRVGKEELEDLIRKGVVRLPEGSIIKEDKVFLALDGWEYLPKEELMTLQHLRAGLYDLALERLNELRTRVHLSSVTIPPKGGKILHTQVRSHNLSLAIELEQQDGVQHSSAFYVQPHSAHSLFVELNGNGKFPVTINGVYVVFYHTEERYVEPRIKVPDYSLPTDKIKRKPHFRSSLMYGPTENGKVRQLMKISPHRPLSLRKFDNFLRSERNGMTYYFYTFPPAEVLDKIVSNSAERKVGSLVFNVPLLEEEKFTAAQYHEIKKLSERGWNIVWDSKQFGRLYFHRFAFMLPEMRANFDRAYSSDSIMAMFGSHNPLRDNDVTNAGQVIKGHKEFTGGDRGYGTIVSGGGPGAMTQFLNLAKSFGLYTGSINILRRGEVQAIDPRRDSNLANMVQAYSRAYVDFFFPFDIMEINTRQDTLVRPASIYVVCEGGFGSFSELYEVCVKKGFILTNEPIFLLGDEKFFQPTLNQIAEMVVRKRVSEQVVSHIYPLDDGSKFLPKLLEHYNFQNMRKS